MGTGTGCGNTGRMTVALQSSLDAVLYGATVTSATAVAELETGWMYTGWSFGTSLHHGVGEVAIGEEVEACLALVCSCVATVPAESSQLLTFACIMLSVATVASIAVLLDNER